MRIQKLKEKVRTSCSTPEGREQWAWCIYDFAKSAFESVLGVFLGPYITYLAQKQACITNSHGCGWCETSRYCIDEYFSTNSTLVPCTANSCWKETEVCCSDGGNFVMFGSTPIAYSAFFSFITSAAVIFQVIFLPIFGAIGDVYKPKKFLIGSTIVSSAALISIVGTNKPELYWVVGLLAIIANVAYGITGIFYNASLIYVAEPDDRDNLSSRGFAVGYIGSVLFLVLCLLIYLRSPGIPTMALLCTLTGVWWIVWAIIPFKFVTSSTPKGEEDKENAPVEHNIFHRAVMKFGGAIRILPRVPQTGLFLIASALYNDGISTIGSQAAVFATYTVHADPTQLLLVVLVINVLAIVGAIVFNFISKATTTKLAIIFGIMIYMVVVIYSYFIRAAWELWIIGVLIGLALGGTQSLSRSLLACIIPPSYENQIFSFYEITQRGTSWIGPLVYGAFTTAYVNNQRPAMLSMLIFLVIGSILLACVNVEKAKEQAA